VTTAPDDQQVDNASAAALLLGHLEAGLRVHFRDGGPAWNLGGDASGLARSGGECGRR
jgi:hypothetical protein